MSTTFRPIGPDDESFLLELYRSTRADELALLPWNDAQKEGFLKMQFTAQYNHYRKHYPSGSFEIILSDERPVGRLYVARSDEKILILDILLAAEERNKGTGTPIIKDLMSEAERAGKPLQIYVENFNPSLRLFERLGFSRVEEDGIYILLEWRSSQGAQA
jgi:RimJ/RimL family protein N-acetyltransferase